VKNASTVMSDAVKRAVSSLSADLVTHDLRALVVAMLGSPSCKLTALDERWDTPTYRAQTPTMHSIGSLIMFHAVSTGSSGLDVLQSLGPFQGRPPVHSEGLLHGAIQTYACLTRRGEVAGGILPSKWSHCW